VSVPDFSWAGRTVLVTGCAGFLGRWLCGELCRRGADVAGLDAPPPDAWRDAAPAGAGGFHGVSGSVEDYGVVRRLFEAYPVTTVFHLAAQSQLGAAARAPRETLDANARGTWNVLEAVREGGRAAPVILASSDAVYGRPCELPFREESPLDGWHPYDVSKILAERAGRMYWRQYGVPVCALRMSNLYGGGDRNLGRIVPGTILAVRRGERPVIRGDGNAERDFLYVEDAVEGYLALAEAMHGSGIAGEAFNLSSGQAVSTRRLVETILEVMGRTDLQPEILNQPSNEPPVKYSAAGKAREIFGWSARTPLREGLRRTAAWYGDAPPGSAPAS
jgi:CDP-glucose 4,6-dehydratase